MVSGEQYVITVGMILMLVWFAGNLDSHDFVCFYFIVNCVHLQCNVIFTIIQMLLPIVVLAMDKELAPFLLMILTVVETSRGFLTAHILVLVLVPTLKMLECSVELSVRMAICMLLIRI